MARPIAGSFPFLAGLAINMSMPELESPIAEGAPPTLPSAIQQTIRRYWGFDQLRPLQADAINAALAHRDSLVVLPTGGGKSLCYQVPPAVSGGTDVVISPLISLMKDQVDGLRAAGYPAAAIYTGVSGNERREVEEGLARGDYRLIFVAPERANTPWFTNLARKLNVRRIAIDEAHCISHWGHDFRPDYRMLAQLREQFPETSFHAFTATATPRVRDDIVRQLGLRDAAVLVGSFDRPNLIFRVVPQVDVYEQAIQVIRRHGGEAVIVYCISRKDTETLASVLNANGIKAEAYHAGLDGSVRHRVQEAFSEERLNVVVATVAFGMGIDRSNVRCVLHTAMPKTIEHYQQEAGRAGRDGLEAECVLLYSASDEMKWESLIRKSAENAQNPRDVIAAQFQLLKQMQRLCNSPRCRHKALVEYFGQTYERENCGACDVCLEDVEGVEDGTVAAQKILSCVARVKESYGVGHVVEVLTGADLEAIRRFEHDKLSTYGLLRDVPKKQVQSMVYQLVDQGLLDRTPGDRPILKLNEHSWQVMRGQLEVRLIKPKDSAPAKSKAAAESWEGVDNGLFEVLREWRKAAAAERHVPPYVIFDDGTLRSLARVRPTSLENLGQIRGIGGKRLADYGESLLATIGKHCAQHHVATDQGLEQEPVSIVRPAKTTPAKGQAYELFRREQSIATVQQTIGRAQSTTVGYLLEFIKEEKPAGIAAWVSPATYQQVRAAAETIEERKLTPIFEKLDGRVPYDAIKLVLAHLEAGVS